ncbi:MAG: hypothetical protein AAF674_22770 [Pseudomonadota bacterium]
MRGLILSVLLLSLGACASPPERTNPLTPEQVAALTISSVEVNGADADYPTTRAAAKRNVLERNLVAALKNTFADRLTGEGPRMHVDVVQLKVTSSGSTAFAGDLSRLVGIVSLLPPAPEPAPTETAETPAIAEKVETADAATTPGSDAVATAPETPPAPVKPLAEYQIDITTGIRGTSPLSALITAAVEDSDGYYNELISKFAERTRTRVLE